MPRGHARKVTHSAEAKPVIPVEESTQPTTDNKVIILNLEQENIALKLRIKKLETDVKNYEQKFKESELPLFRNYPNSSYNRWRIERIRKEIGVKTLVNICWKSYKYWCETHTDVKKLTTNDFKRFLASEFGEPTEDDYYVGIVCFDTQASIDEWIKVNEIANI